MRHPTVQPEQTSMQVLDTVKARFKITEQNGISRRREPIFVSIPLSRGQTKEIGQCQLEGVSSSPAQTSVLNRWPDGSVQWVGVTFLADIEGHASADVTAVVTACSELAQNKQATHGGRIEVNGWQFRLWEDSRTLFDLVRPAAQGNCQLAYIDPNDQSYVATITSWATTEEGPVRTSHRFQGLLGPSIEVGGKIAIYPAAGLVYLQLTLLNPGRAQHKRGYWDLGDPGSVLIKGLTVALNTQLGAERRVAFRDTFDEAVRFTDREVSIYQESSGGEKWNSRVHLNRNGQVPMYRRGYILRCGKEQWTGDRCTPLVGLSCDVGVTVSMPEFWQRFPCSMETCGDSIQIGMLPTCFPDLHELQAGERLTRELWIHVSDSPQPNPLDFVHAPVAVSYDAGAVEMSQVLFGFCSGERSRPEFGVLCSDAISGKNNFFAKRETIDEYGWRNYGDVWADHEEQFYVGPKPVISHYNNQYDVLHSFLVQFLRTGDRRWWNLADPLARHIIDIDIYSTSFDKSAFNGGLFWHTAHYQDAGTCTHRSMSQLMIGNQNPSAPGGGPGNEHNYTSGLVLYYLLTGNEAAREAAVGLADWVIRMDDGRGHIFGLLADGPTGLASFTREPDYHGPGRGAGNSINALTDAWILTKESQYLAAAETIIRRAIHPCVPPGRHELLDAERRWSYTVFLQSLLKFHNVFQYVPDACPVRDYVLASLNTYGSWMVNNEAYYLDQPDTLEFPTETWAAQELRKGMVLLMIARFAMGASRKQMVQRGRDILDRAWQDLLNYPTRDAARPLAIVLQQGYLEQFANEQLAKYVGPESVIEMSKLSFPENEPFVTQRESIARLASSPKGLCVLAARAMTPSRWRPCWSRLWIREQLRKKVARFFC